MSQQAAAHRVDRERWAQSEGATSDALWNSDAELSKARHEREEARADAERKRLERDEAQAKLAQTLKDLEHVRAELRETRRIALISAAKHGTNSQAHLEQTHSKALPAQLRAARTAQKAAERAIEAGDKARKREREGWRWRLEEAERTIASLRASIRQLKTAGVGTDAVKEQRRVQIDRQLREALAAAQESRAKALRLEEHLGACRAEQHRHHAHGRYHHANPNGCASNWLRDVTLLGSGWAAADLFSLATK